VDTVTLTYGSVPPMRKLHRTLIFSPALAASAFAQGTGVLFPTERLMLQAHEEAEIQPGTMGKTFRKPVLQTPLSVADKFDLSHGFIVPRALSYECCI
jgi:hypothetical protein